MISPYYIKDEEVCNDNIMIRVSVQRISFLNIFKNNEIKLNITKFHLKYLNVLQPFRFMLYCVQNRYDVYFSQKRHG